MIRKLRMGKGVKIKRDEKGEGTVKGQKLKWRNEKEFSSERMRRKWIEIRRYRKI